MLNANANANAESNAMAPIFLNHFYRKTANAPTSPPATPTIAPAVCTAAPPVDETAAGPPVALATFNPGPAAPPVVCIPPCLITLASATALPVLTPLAPLVVELANTPTLVALAPQTQWLMVPSAILANMFTQYGADEAVQAIAAASL